MKTILIAAVAGVLIGCATSPPASAPAAAAVAAAPASGAAPAAEAMSQETKDLHKWARMQGYKQANRPQGLMWCKEDVSIGTHLPHIDCLKEETLAEMRKTYESNRDEMLRATRGCNSTTFCGSN